MSALEKLLDLDQAAATLATSATESREVGIAAAGEIIDFDRAKARRDITRANAKRERSRQKLLALMAKAPESKRYFWEADENSSAEYIILTLAVRGIGSCEFSIPRDNYDGFSVLELLAQMS